MHQLSQISVDRGEARPLGEQIAAQLRELALAGAFQPGERLPATRQLAGSLGVSRSVVVGAYEQLIGEGFLVAVPGSGTAVADGLLRPAVLRPRPGASLPESPGPSGAIDLRPGRPLPPDASGVDWRRAVRHAAGQPLSADPPPDAGLDRLRAEIARHVWHARGIRCAPADVIVTAGATEALLLVALALRSGDRGPRIGVEDPGYQNAAAVVRRVGGRAVPLPIGADGVRIGAIAAAGPLDALIVTPSHQYPLGGRLPAADRIALLAEARRLGAVLIEDDYDSEFRHAGPLLPAIAALDGGGAIAHVGSFNKTFSPSLRCGYLVLVGGEPEFRRELWGARADAGATVAALTQHALAEFLASGGYRRTLARTRREYRHRRQTVIELLGEPGGGAELSGLDGGLHAVLTLPEALPGVELRRRLAAAGVLVESLDEFRTAGEPARNGLAIGYGAEPTLRLREGLSRVLAELRRG